MKFGQLDFRVIWCGLCLWGVAGVLTGRLSAQQTAPAEGPDLRKAMVAAQEHTTQPVKLKATWYPPEKPSRM